MNYNIKTQARYNISETDKQTSKQISVVRITFRKEKLFCNLWNSMFLVRGFSGKMQLKQGSFVFYISELINQIARSNSILIALYKTFINYNHSSAIKLNSKVTNVRKTAEYTV